MRRAAPLALLAGLTLNDTDGRPSAAAEAVLRGGAALRLEVECLEIELADLGPVWTTTCCPAHQHETT